jgi:hypothetical protein
VLAENGKRWKTSRFEAWFQLHSRRFSRMAIIDLNNVFHVEQTSKFAPSQNCSTWNTALGLQFRHLNRENFFV